MISGEHCLTLRSCCLSDPKGIVANDLASLEGQPKIENKNYVEKNAKEADKNVNSDSLMGGQINDPESADGNFKNTPHEAYGANLPKKEDGSSEFSPTNARQGANS